MEYRLPADDVTDVIDLGKPASLAKLADLIKLADLEATLTA